MSNNFYVYTHNRIGSGLPFYVGKGRDKRAYSRNGRNQYWHRIVKKDGGFTTAFLVKDVDEEFAMLAEVEAIAVFRKRGFALANITDGGDGVSGWKHTPETRAKISASNIGNKFGLGFRHSDEARQKMSANRKGQAAWNKGGHHSDETRAQMSIDRKGMKAWNKGKKHTAETILKMSASHKGQAAWNKGVPRSETLKRQQSILMSGNTYRRGQKASAETRLKQSAAHLARWARVRQSKENS